MARRAVAGYPEKSYYENTTFQGVVATGDPLNEGSFALLTNLDISDTGQSVSPRKGFLTTTLETSEGPVTLTKKSLFYRDPNLQRDIIIDLNKFNKEDWAFLTDITQYKLNTKKYLPAEAISKGGIDIDDLIVLMQTEDIYAGDLTPLENIQYLFDNSSLLDGHILKIARSITTVTAFITKLRFDNAAHQFNYFLKVYYRKDAPNETLSADTMILSYIDTQAQTESLANRNIASKKSILLDPILHMQAENADTDGDLILPGVLLLAETEIISVPPSMPYNPQGFSIAYLEDGPYLSGDTHRRVKGYLNKVVDSKLKAVPNNIIVAPSFHLPKASSLFIGEGVSNPLWAYRFDVINTDNTKLPPIYKSPWRKLEHAQEDNDIIPELNIMLSNSGGAYNAPLFTYYVTADSTALRHTTTGVTFSDPSRNGMGTFAAQEGEYFMKLRSNTQTPSSGAPGTYDSVWAVFAALKSVFKDVTSETISTLNRDFLDKNQFVFIPENSVNSLVYKPGESNSGETLATLEDYTERTSELSSQDLNDLLTHVYAANTNTIKTPILYFSKDNYDALHKLNATNFIVHVLDKLRAHDVRLVFLPFSRRRVGTTGSSNQFAFDDIYLCSMQGIYINGLKAFLYDYSNDSGLTLGNPRTFQEVQTTLSTQTIPLVERNFNVLDIFAKVYGTSLGDLINKGIPSSAFSAGVNVILYLKAYTTEMLNAIDGSDYLKLVIANQNWDASAYMIASSNVWGKDGTYINLYDKINPPLIENAKRFITFEDRLVTWNANNVFISEEGVQGYFIEGMKKEFPEEVLKVIAFKTILLVFTTQHLYAIYRVELETPTEEVNEQGEPKVLKTITWVQQPVLYNLNPERDYLDVIQVYNQMILFYSNEGQLYMIRPSTTIDRDTQFSIQYFNKSANDILNNYTDYINERLIQYGKIKSEGYEDFVTREQVQIHCLVDIDYIKIFFTVPNQITFILIYDVIHNRYTTYDTLSFNDIVGVEHVEGGELYLTQEGSSLFLTLPVLPKLAVDQNMDIHYNRQFRKEPIFTLVDTGNLNLNNHLRKRLRDLRITLKNIDATKILYSAEIYTDDTRLHPFYAPEFKVKMINGPAYSMVIDPAPVDDVNELFGMNQIVGIEGNRDDMKLYRLHEDHSFFETNRLLKTETINSSRLIEYNSNVLGMGKSLRIKLQLISTGKYKLQSFGIVYKERRV